VPNYADWLGNQFQYSLEDYNTSTPEGDQQAVSYAPGWLPELLDLRQKVESGQGTPWDRAWYEQQASAARAVPMRDPSGLTYNAGDEAPDRLSGGSRDLGNLMLTLQDKMRQGTATPQERSLFDTTYKALVDQNWRASTPQASDAFSPLGDNLMSALGILGIGATGGLAGGALAAGGGLASTLGSLGTLSGIAGTGAGVLGQATDQDWLSQLGLGLGIAGGLAGGLGGLSNLWSSGVGSLSDAAKLAQSAGKITGSLGRIPGAEPLKDVSRYLGYAGQAGQFGAGIGADAWLGWSGDNAPLAQNVAPQVNSNVSNLLSAADMATQRGGGNVADFSYEDFLGWGDPNAGDPWNSPMPADTPGWEDFTGWGGDETQTGWYQNANLDTSGGGGNWLQTILGGLGGAGKLLAGGGGGNGAGGAGGLLGPLLSSLGSVGGGAIGSNAANEAARLQAAALNRGLSLQEAQWLQSQANQAPWMAAGRDALGHMAGRSTGDQPTLGQLAPISGANYALPNATPGWSPQTMDANAYRWTPGQGPQAANYQYRPGQTPDAAAYQSGPPQLYQGAMPGTQVPTLTGQQVLDQDPGAAFRQSEARKALEGSAAARGDLLSGGTLQALQSRSQDLAAQEYQSAWQRMMARNTEQYGRDWGQYQQNWNQGVQGTQLGLQTNAQNFGQAMSAAQLREQVNQVASQQGWNQAQAEAAFREAMAQQASQQGWSQSLQGQQWNQQQAQQYQQELYNRMLQNNQLQYNRDWQSTEAQNQRLMDAYNAQRQGQNTAWNQFASLAGLGQTSVGQLGQLGQANAQQQGSLLGQLGTAQGLAPLGGALSWQKAIGGATNQLPSILAGLNA
jgi:hypothetical protein